MNKKYKVNGYNFRDMTIKHWKFYHGITEIKSKKLVEQLIRGGSKSVYAKWRGKD